MAVRRGEFLLLITPPPPPAGPGPVPPKLARTRRHLVTARSGGQFLQLAPAGTVTPARDFTITHSRLQHGWTASELADGWQVGKAQDGWTIGRLEG